MPEIGPAFKEFLIQVGRQSLGMKKQTHHMINGQVRTKDVLQCRLWAGVAGGASWLEGLMDK